MRQANEWAKHLPKPHLFIRNNCWGCYTHLEDLYSVPERSGASLKEAYNIWKDFYLARLSNWKWTKQPGNRWLVNLK